MKNSQGGNQGILNFTFFKSQGTRRFKINREPPIGSASFDFRG